MPFLAPSALSTCAAGGTAGTAPYPTLAFRQCLLLNKPLGSNTTDLDGGRALPTSFRHALSYTYLRLTVDAELTTLPRTGGRRFAVVCSFGWLLFLPSPTYTAARTPAPTATLPAPGDILTPPFLFRRLFCALPPPAYYDAQQHYRGLPPQRDNDTINDILSRAAFAPPRHSLATLLTTTGSYFVTFVILTMVNSDCCGLCHYGARRSATSHRFCSAATADFLARRHHHRRRGGYQTFGWKNRHCCLFAWRWTFYRAFHRRCNLGPHVTRQNVRRQQRARRIGAPSHYLRHLT